MTDKFENPYKVEVPAFNGPGKNLCRAPASIGAADYDFIRRIRPSTGTVNITQNLLWYKLVQALKLYGITDITNRDQFESFVANCRIVDNRPCLTGGGTAGGDAPQTPGGDDGRRTPNVGGESAHAADVKSDAPSGDRKTKGVRRRTAGNKG